MLMAIAPVPLGGAEETARPGHRAHYPASQQLVSDMGGWGVWGQPRVGGRALSAVLKEAPKPLEPLLLCLLGHPNIHPLLPALSICVFIFPFFSSLFAPPPISTTSSRFINARRRIVQPMIDQSNRTGTGRRWGERAWCSWGMSKPGPGILGLSLHPSTSLAGQSAAFSPESQPMGGYTETLPHGTVRPPGKGCSLN